MPTFELQGPDGAIYEVEASDMQSAASAFQSMSPAQTRPNDGVTGKLAAFGEGASNGIPIVGPYVDKATDAYVAGMQALLNGTSYADEVKTLQDRQKGLAERNPISATAGEIAGGVAGTAPMVMAAPAAFGAGAGGMVARSAASLASGGAIGLADQGVRTGGDTDAMALGGGLGAVFGAAAPSIGKAVGAGASRVMDYFGRPDNALNGISRPAVRYAQETALDPVKQGVIRSELDRLGPEAMLADVSPEWMGVARGAASRPGSRDMVVNALLERGSGKNARLATDLDASLGPAGVPSFIEEGIAGNQRALAQQYADVIAQAGPVDTTALAQGLDALRGQLRGRAQTAVGQVRGMLNEVGGEGLDADPGTLLQTRQAIDGMLATETDTNAVRNLTMARQQVDDELARAAPGIKDVDASYAELARQREGLQRGGQAFDSGKTAPRPVEFEQEFTNGALPQGQQIGPSAVPLRMQQGARAEMDRIAGQNANDPAALQRLVRGEGDWNRQKLATLYGPQRADEALSAIDRETAFYRTQNRVTGGSDTAMAQRFGNFLDDAAKPAQIPLEASATGLVARALQRAAGGASKEAAEAKAARFADELGALSVARGADRDAIVQALMRSIERRQGSELTASRARELAEILVRGGGPVAANPR